MVKDYEMIQEIGKYEDSHNFSDAERVTSWYGDYAMYEQKFGIADEKILERYKEMQGKLEEKNVPKREAAKDPFLKDCEWTHYSDGSGDLCRRSNGESLAKYNLGLRELKLYDEYFYFHDEPEFSLKSIVESAEAYVAERMRCRVIGFYEAEHDLPDAERITVWNPSMGEFLRLGGISDEKLQERYDQIMEKITRKEPAEDPFLKGYVWEHYIERQCGDLLDEKGEVAASYNLYSTYEIEVNGEPFALSETDGIVGCTLKIAKEKAEEYTVERIRCNVIGAYEKEHKLPDNVRLTQWDPLIENYLRLDGVGDEKLQQRYDQIINNAMKKQVQPQPVPMCK